MVKHASPAHPSLVLIVSSRVWSTGGRCSAGNRERDTSFEERQAHTTRKPVLELGVLYCRLHCRPVSGGKLKGWTEDGHRNSRSQGLLWQSSVLAELGWTGILTSPSHGHEHERSRTRAGVNIGRDVCEHSLGGNQEAGILLQRLTSGLTPSWWDSLFSLPAGCW